MNGHELVLMRQNFFFLERLLERKSPLPPRQRVGVQEHYRASSPSLQSSPIKEQGVGLWSKVCWFTILFLISTLTDAVGATAAETAEQIIAGAKREGDEIVFVAGAQTFGGRKGLAELETGFNKRYGLKTSISFAAGPDMNARAARLITEVKAGRKSSTDLYLGSQSHFALLHKENALEKVNWAGTFPWLTKEMEIFPGEGVLVYTHPTELSITLT